MRTHIRPALVLLIILSVLTGLVYPAVVTGVVELGYSLTLSGVTGRRRDAA